MSEQSTGGLGLLGPGVAKLGTGPESRGPEGLHVNQEEPFSGLLNEQILALSTLPEAVAATFGTALPDLPHGNTLPPLLELAVPEATEFKPLAGELLSTVKQLGPRIVAAVDAGSLPDSASGPMEPELTIGAKATSEQTGALARVTHALASESGTQLKTMEVPLVHSQSTQPTAALAQAVSPAIPGEISFRGEVVQTIQTPVSAPGWSQEFGTRVSWLVKQNVSSAEIRLNPPELGPIAVKISVDGGETQIHFSAQHAQSRELLEQASFRLRESLMESGFSTVNVDIGNGQTGGFDNGPEADIVAEDNFFHLEEDSSSKHGVVATQQGLVDKYV